MRVDGDLVDIDFTGFYQREFGRLQGLAWSLTGDGEHARDIAQTALADAYANWARVCSRERPELWVRRMVVNLSATHRRNRRRNEEKLHSVAGQPRFDPPAIGGDALRFAELVRELPPLQLRVVVLRYLEDRTVADIASILEVAEGTVKTSLHRARRNLAARLSQEVNDHA